MQEGQHPGVGSPPHSRGRRAVENIPLERYGITPAFAGKASRDHPRIRGEGLLLLAWACAMGGSPPHSRGRPDHVRGEDHRLGITPAFAGKAGRCPRNRGCPQDHPRIRGEGPALFHVLGSGAGSPPHSRGRRGEHLDHSADGGITPAFAGKASHRARPRP